MTPRIRSDPVGSMTMRDVVAELTAREGLAETGCPSFSQSIVTLPSSSAVAEQLRRTVPPWYATTSPPGWTRKRIGEL